MNSIEKVLIELTEREALIKKAKEALIAVNTLAPLSVESKALVMSPSPLKGRIRLGSAKTKTPKYKLTHPVNRHMVTCSWAPCARRFYALRKTSDHPGCNKMHQEWIYRLNGKRGEKWESVAKAIVAGTLDPSTIKKGKKVTFTPKEQEKPASRWKNKTCLANGLHPECKGEFTPSRPHGLYCSQQCARAFQRRRSGRIMDQKVNPKRTWAQSRANKGEILVPGDQLRANHSEEKA